jgi:hypothetical protein
LAELASGAIGFYVNERDFFMSRFRLSSLVRSFTFHFQHAAHSKFICLVCGILLVLFMSLALISVAPSIAEAQRVGDLSTVTVDGVSRESAPSDAVKEATAWAVLSTAREQVIEVLGAATFEKNKAAIEKKIIKQSTRFIPFVNPGSPVEQKDGSWKVPVELKVSQASLRKILLDEGFVGTTANGTSSAASILPLVAFTDRTKTVSLRWWMGDEKGADQKYLVSLENMLHAKLADEIQKQNLVLTKPPTQEANFELPQNLQIERPSSQDLSALAAYFKVAMIARGDVRVVPSNVAGAGTVTVKIQVVQATAPDRVIAEVVREFTSDPHAPSMEAGVRNKAVSEFAALSKDLAIQVQAAWQRGTVGTNFVSLAVRGALNPQEQTAFKTAFVRNVHEVRDLKERMFEHELVTYEADFSGDAAQFANRMRALKLAGFDIRVGADTGSRVITLDVKPSNQL